jgi:hypothetical protein
LPVIIDCVLERIDDQAIYPTPPPVDCRLVNTGALGDTLDGQFRVSAFGKFTQGGPADSLAVAGGSSPRSSFPRFEFIGHQMQLLSH